MKPRVWVTRLIPEAGLAMVREAAEAEVWEDELPPPRQVVLDKVKEIEGLLPLLTDRIDAEVMGRASRLRVISNYAVGYDNIEVPAATERGILVTNTPGVLTETTADLAWALLMAAARRIVEADRFVRERKWKTWGPRLFLGYDVHHATLGIIGMGRIGTEVAKRAHGFEMRVLYFDPHRRPPDQERELGAEYRPLDELLRESDFVSVHCLLDQHTRHLIGRKELAAMKATAVLINTARGPIVDEQALIEALQQRRIAHAALDVTDPEPPAPDSPLLRLDNVTIIPHIASASHATRSRMATMAAENLIAGLRGERPPNLVNPETWKAS